MKIKRTYETILSIEFSDKNKAENHFIDSDWSEFFWDMSDLEELGECILDAFVNIPHGDLYKKHERYARGKNIEGFDDFVSNFGCDEYKSSNDEYGDIIVKIVQEPERQ